MTTPVMQAYRFALDPTPGQVRDLERHAGAARFAYNWALAAVKANIRQRNAERSYDINADELTPALGWNLPALRRAWNQAKDDVAPWWVECSKEAFNTGLDGVARALKNFGDAKSGTRAGRKVGFPRFKARRRATPSVRFTTGAIRVESDRKHVTLPRIGTIKTHESTRKLARRIEQGTARILTATVRREAGRWFCSFTCEVQHTQRAPTRPNLVVGVDLGVTHLAVLSSPVPGVSDPDGFVPNPKHWGRAQRALARASRQVSRRVGPDRRTGQRPSKRWEKANQQRNTIHHRVANLRRDGLHKLTTGLAATIGIVVVEDLNVAGMLRNKRLARSIADAGFAEIRRQLTYKTGWGGGRLVVVGRWFPSSKTCSTCGVVKPKLPLRVRTFTCEHCGLVIDRDRNAAINLAHQVAQSGWETRNGRGADQKTKPGLAGGCEASTPHRLAG
ncbi:MAG TPA: IS607 family element RNA-guided endonuclease TnpB [Pseudonocardiaceae bacterium]